MPAQCTVYHVPADLQGAFAGASIGASISACQILNINNRLASLSLGEYTSRAPSFMKSRIERPLFILLLASALFVSPAVALFMGMAFALVFAAPYGSLTRKVSKYLLQLAVVGLGFGMNFHEAMSAGREGMLLTIISVVGVMVLGWMMGKLFGVPTKMSYLIASGTAICGGSAIAAVSPAVKANEHEISVSLAVIFVLNAIALFIFPPIGEMIGLSEHQFGTWAAIAIHDTSSVVGAAAIFGEEALKVATTVKLTRALWIIPLALVSSLIFMKANTRQQGRVAGVSIPWFILFFILAMVANTYLAVPDMVSAGIRAFSHQALAVTLFLIGSGVSVAALRHVGAKPIALGIALWCIISVATLGVVLW